MEWQLNRRDLGSSKMGMEDLASEIEADEIKQIQPVWRQVRLLFDRDFRERFLTNIRTKKAQALFSSPRRRTDSKPEFRFKGRKMLLNLFADNKRICLPLRIGQHRFRRLEPRYGRVGEGGFSAGADRAAPGE
jgi:hypothetical protein